MHDIMMFRQVVEKALNMVYNPDDNIRNAKWNRIYDWYEARYLNPDSPERNNNA